MKPAAIKIVPVESIAPPFEAKPLPDNCAWGQVEGKHVIVKTLPRKNIINECVGYLMARAAGLKTPDAFLARPNDHDFQFVSVKQTMISLKDMGIAWDSSFWADAHKAKWFAMLFAFDTWVGNYDRIVQNIWFKGDVGNETLVVLDHDKILFNVNWNVLILNDYHDRPGFNALTRSITNMDAALEQHLAVGAEKLLAAIGPDDLARLSCLRDCGVASRHDVKAITNVLTARLKRLPQLVAEIGRI